MKNKNYLLNRIKDIQNQFPAELLKHTFLNLIDENNLEEFFARSLVTFPPIFLPIFESDGDIFAIHLKTNRSWSQGAWVKLAHDLEYPYLIASSFTYLPYAFFVAPLNVKDYVDEIWTPIISMIEKNTELKIPPKKNLHQEIDETYKFLSIYDLENISAKISAFSETLWEEDVKDELESMLQQFPNSIFTQAGTARLRSELQYSNPVNLAINVLLNEIPFGFYSLLWFDDGDSGPGILESMRQIALPSLQDNHPLKLLENSPFTDQETAKVLKKIASKYSKMGDDLQALNQIRNGASVIGSFGEGLTKDWCLEIAKYTEKIEKDGLSTSLANFAAEVFHLGP